MPQTFFVLTGLLAAVYLAQTDTTQYEQNSSKEESSYVTEEARVETTQTPPETYIPRELRSETFVPLEAPTEYFNVGQGQLPYATSTTLDPQIQDFGNSLDQIDADIKATEAIIDAHIEKVIEQTVQSAGQQTSVPTSQSIPPRPGTQSTYPTPPRPPLPPRQNTTIVPLAPDGEPDRVTTEPIIIPTRRPLVSPAMELRAREVGETIKRDVRNAVKQEPSAQKNVDIVNKKVKEGLVKLDEVIKEEVDGVVEERGEQAAEEAKEELLTEVRMRAERITETRKSFEDRGGDTIFKDTDFDGVSDYDEVYIYKTNPREAYTVEGSTLSDGEKIKFGINPVSEEAQEIVYEDPRLTEHPILLRLKVTDIQVNIPAPLELPGENVTDTELLPIDHVVPAQEEIVFRGKALPNSFVTLYIFSTPIIVTVKTDSDGVWEYALKEELPNGEHNMYVATVDNGGNILARSEPVPFVKQANAVQFTSSDMVATPVTERGIARESFIPQALMLLGAVILGAIIALGAMARRKTPGTIPPYAQ